MWIGRRKINIDSKKIRKASEFVIIERCHSLFIPAYFLNYTMTFFPSLFYILYHLIKSRLIFFLLLFDLCYALFQYVIRYLSDSPGPGLYFNSDTPIVINKSQNAWARCVHHLYKYVHTAHIMYNYF